DAMPHGGDLRISCAEAALQDDPELSAGRYVRLTVSDQGVGMSEDVLARIFEPFFTTKPAGKGTGLGLSQVYAVVHQANGAVRVSSRVGAGTTVEILLPVAADPAATNGTESEVPQMRPRPASVLVVDDDPDVRSVAVAMLEALGCRVTEAPDGVTALALIETQAPELLLLDFAMPGMTGAELARRVRERHPDLPIVFATGYSDSEAMHQAVGRNAPVLRKPFRMDQLQSMLSEVLDR
ncbi:MAG TPA: response regulator, partial [Acetobacteraceae bacterium]|nr:response regulator [Acetobacteraceae bacterium]